MPFSTGSTADGVARCERRLEGRRRRRIRALASGLLSGLAAAGLMCVPQTAAIESAGLLVSVTGVRSDLGRIRVAAWSDRNTFTEPHGIVQSASEPAAAGEVIVALSGLAPGRYALAAYHDENDNDRFDRRWFGMPREGFGFSNGATVDFDRLIPSAPSFDDAAVEVTGAGQTLMIDLTYPSPDSAAQSPAPKP